MHSQSSSSSCVSLPHSFSFLENTPIFEMCSLSSLDPLFLSCLSPLFLLFLSCSLHDFSHCWVHATFSLLLPFPTAELTRYLCLYYLSLIYTIKPSPHTYLEIFLSSFYEIATLNFLFSHQCINVACIKINMISWIGSFMSLTSKNPSHIFSCASDILTRMHLSNNFKLSSLP